MNQSNILLLVLFLQLFHRNLRLWLIVVVAVLRSIDILSLIKLILINFLALVGIVDKRGIIVFANRH